MFNQYKILFIIIFALFFILADFTAGVYYEHEKFAAYKNQQQGALQLLTDEVNALNLKNKENANEAEQNTITAVQSIHAWYVAHPVVRVQQCTNSSYTLPVPVTDTGKPDATAAAEYVSPYSPDATEIVAARLNELQTLLRKSGVKIK